MRVIAIVNHKGGVGKTTTTLNLGAALALEGKQVLLIDLDPQANLSQALDKEEQENNIYQALSEDKPLPVSVIKPNLNIVPAALELSKAESDLRNDVKGYFRLRKAFKLLPQTYDYVLIDCPPSLGILTINALMAAQEVLITLNPQFFALKGLQTIFDLISDLQEDLNPDLKISGLLITQLQRNSLNKEISDLLYEDYAKLMFKSTIRQTVGLAEAVLNRQDIFAYDAKSIGASDYQHLAKELIYGN